MAGWSKWVFGGLGWAMGGPLGGILGFGLGAALDGASKNKSGMVSSGPTGPGDFGAVLLVLCAAVMKSDGKVLRSELDFVKAFFVRQFGESKAGELVLVLRDFLKQDLPLEEVCRQARIHLGDPERLQLLHLLFGISLADGEVHPGEVETISKISNFLGVSKEDFLSIKAMFVKDTTSAYKILEISEHANDEEVKLAFRNMAKKHHPDKVHHLGPDFQQAAQEKFKAINEAYEQIKKQRGIK